MKSLLKAMNANPYVLVYDDFPTAFTPERWANESIAILVENMVIGNLVHKDFSAEIAEAGDTVNTRKPGEFKAKRKSSADTVTVQSTTATNVAVVLNQHLHTSFMIKDKDQSLSFKDLVAEYLAPGMLSIARAVDTILLAQVHQFHAYSGGNLNGLTNLNGEDYLLDARLTLNINKAHETGRNMILGPRSDTQLLRNQNFTSAYAVGDQGQAMKEAALGRKFGFELFQAQNTPYVATGNTIVTGAVNMAGGAAAGATSLTVDGLAAAISNGTWFTVAGDDTPLRVVSTTGGATPTAIVAHRALKRAVADNAVVTLYTPAAVNNASGYAVGYDKEITIDGTTPAPQIGQAVTFGTANPGTSPVYTIIDVDGVIGITLDRALEVALSDNDTVNLGPAGSYNFAFHRNALALVSRPLALPMPGIGARAGVANFNGFSMRVTMTYDGNKQGTLVTVDTLMGVKVLDTLLGAVMFG